MLIKKVIPFFIIISSILFLSQQANAQVLINEFSPNSQENGYGDWIELYTLEKVDLSEYYLTHIKTDGTEGIINIPEPYNYSSHQYKVVPVSNYLGNTGDRIRLYKTVNTSLIDDISYGGADEVCLPNASGSIGRYPDGATYIDRFSIISKDSENRFENLSPCPAPSPTITLTPTPTLTPSPTQTPTSTQTATPKGYFKINDAKDSSGNLLSQVKIYIDGTYIHHYAPETLTFCDGCKCDEVSCGFGSHTFKLEKSGYTNWTETKTINNNDNFETSPVLSLSSSIPTATNTPKPSPKPTLTILPTAVDTISDKINDDFGEMVLGYQNSETQISTASTKTQEKDEKKRIQISIRGDIFYYKRDCFDRKFFIFIC